MKTVQLSGRGSSFCMGNAAAVDSGSCDLVATCEAAEEEGIFCDVALEVLLWESSLGES